MKRRGFLKLLAAAPVALAIKPAKKKVVIDNSPVLSEYYKQRLALIEIKAKEAMNELMAEEDRRMFKMLGALA